VTRNNIEQLIEVMKKDSFLSHLITIITRDYRPSGEICKNDIRIWKQSLWNALFYPIFILELNSSNELVRIKDKLNPVCKFIIGLITFGFIYYLTSWDFSIAWPIITIFCVFAIIVALVASMIYRFERKNQLEEIHRMLGVELASNKTIKTWSLKRFLTRLFLYPFCVLLIGLNIFLIIPNGQYFLALATLTIVGVYLVSDLKILIKKTTGNNK